MARPPKAPSSSGHMHCSAVFLVGEHAYKLKRAIAYASLDYTTTERREAACRAELALNRRTAPDPTLPQASPRALRKRAHLGSAAADRAVGQPLRVIGHASVPRTITGILESLVNTWQRRRIGHHS